MKRLIHICLVASSVLLGRSTQAAVIQYEFSGKVATVDDLGPLHGLVQVGDSYTARFVLNTATPDEYPEDPNLGGYPGALGSLVMDHISLSANGRVDVGNWPLLDSVGFSSSDPGVMFYITLKDPTATALTSDAIPASFLPFAGFPESSLSVFWEPSPSKFSGSIDAVSITPIPEPSALRLIVLGLMPAWKRVRSAR